MIIWCQLEPISDHPKWGMWVERPVYEDQPFHFKNGSPVAQRVQLVVSRVSRLENVELSTMVVMMKEVEYLWQ
jgi:hypothetical protein